MRERSHKKGEVYQRAVKAWLSGHTFFGFRLNPKGSAYDATASLARIGNEHFDLSFALEQGEEAEGLLFIECKYRKPSASIDGDFDEFIERVVRACFAAGDDERSTAYFCFVATVPPREWRQFLGAPRIYCEKLMRPRGREFRTAIDAAASRIYVLVLGADMIRK